MALDPDHNAAVEEWRRLGSGRPGPTPRPGSSSSSSSSGFAALIRAILAAFRRP